MKTSTLKHKTLTGVTALLLGGANWCLAQTADITLQSFDANANGTGVEWGSGAIAFDGANGNPPGAALVTVNFSNGSDTPSVAYICASGGNPWYHPQNINFSQYKSVEFDIKWDNTSDINIPQFNSLSTWPADLTNSLGNAAFNPGTPAGALSGSLGGLDIEFCGAVNQMSPALASTNIPNAASNGWVHISLPINPAQAGIDGQNGIVFHKWINNHTVLSTNANSMVVARFWIDNVVVKGTAGPPPPPTVNKLEKPIPGLNVFSSTQGNSFYDRQEAVLKQTTGLGWVGHATTGNPVTYSFTIVGYPKSENCEAYFFLAPNEPSQTSAPDWNETNCAIFFIQGDPNQAIGHFQYKVNEPGNNQMYGGGSGYTNPPGSWDGVTNNWPETGNLAAVTNNGIFGTWKLKFTSDTNGSIIAPNGTATSFVIPAYNGANFAETANFNLYLGMQANNQDGMNQAVVYSDFAVSGVASPLSQHFLSQTVLDTNVWSTSLAGGPKGVLVIPTSGPAYWMTWTLPDPGFSLTGNSTLTGGAWGDISQNFPIGMAGVRKQLVEQSELPSADHSFFRLIQRQFSQLQILWPGETNAPNTVTGKIGTPAVTNNTLVTFTVNACDSTWHIINVTGDTIGVTSTGADVLPNDAPLASGSVQMQILFGAAGSDTVTAADTTDNTKASAVSTVNVQ
jgi:hypothetical protein